MRGRQLVSIRKGKSKAYAFQSPIGFVQGISEEIQSISPKDRRIRNQIYLKGILPNTIPHRTISPSISDVIDPSNDLKQSTRISNFTSISTKKKEKIFHLDPNSRFSVHFHETEEKELTKLNYELFPKEIIDDIHYLPDYTQTRLIKHLKLDTSVRSSSQDPRSQDNTIGNLVKSRLENRKIDLQKLRSSKFTTYSTGWGDFSNHSPVKLPRKRLGHLQSLLPSLA